MYKIKLITDKNGKERLDGRYPLRKNCIVDIHYVDIGNVAILEYVKDSKGFKKDGYLRTSTVEYYEVVGNSASIHTLNSIYYLDYLEEN